MPERIFVPPKVISKFTALYLICLVLIVISCRWSAAQPFAYISDPPTATVTVIDTSTNTVATTIPVGNYPVGVAVHPAGTRVYVANLNSNTISVIDASTNAVIDTISVGQNPRGVAVHPVGTRVYVTNYEQGGNGSVSVIDTSTDTVIATVTVGFAPEGVAVHPDGTRVYVADQSNVVSVINTATNTVSARISVGGAPAGVAVHPNGARVYVASFLNNALAVIDTATNSVISTVGVGTNPFGVAVHPDGSRIYVASTVPTAPAGFGGGTFSVIDTTMAETDPAHAETARPTVAIGSAGYGVAVTPDGARLYYAGRPVSVVDTATNTLITSMFAGFGPAVFGQFIGPATISPTLPHITNLSPASGPAGTLVTIVGENFGSSQGSSTVTFGVTVATVSSWSDTQITISIPPLSPENYPIIVMTENEASNAIPFLLTIPPTNSDFVIAIAPPRQTAIRGLSTLYQVLVRSINGFNEPVTLSITGLPPGTSTTLNSNTISPVAGTDLIVKTSPATPLGTHPFTIQGNVNGLMRSTTGQLVVKRSQESVLSLSRSFSLEKPLLLTFQYRKQTTDASEAVVTLTNLTGTWIKAIMNIMPGAVSVTENQVPSVLLLGPFANKSLGVITFGEGQFLQYEGERINFEALTALTIDLFLRGTLGHEIPSDFFFNLFSGGQLAFNLAGNIFREIGANCQDLAFRVGFDLVDGKATEILSDVAKFINCTGIVKKSLLKLFTKILKDPLLANQSANSIEEGFDTILSLLRVPEHAIDFANLMCPSLVPPIDGFFESLGLCAIIGAPANGFVRLEAIP